MHALEAELADDARATLGEGPVWDVRANALYWLDIVGATLHRFQADGSVEQRPLSESVTAIAPHADGGLVATVSRGFAHLDPGTGAIERLGEVIPDGVNVRMNDGKCDPQGRFWAGSMSRDLTPGLGGLFRLDSDGEPVGVRDGVSLSNGLAWSRDSRTMFHIDSLAYAVTAYDFDPAAGALGDGRIVVKFDPDTGLPDGMSIDAEGMLWIAVWGGSGVYRYSPNGELLAVVDVPVTQVTSCAFGGASYDELFITTAREGLSEEELETQPLAGGLFRCRTGTAGLPPAVFAA